MWMEKSPNSGGPFDVETLDQRVSELERKIAEPGFWDDQEKAQKTLKQLSSAKAPAEAYRGLARRAEDLRVLLQLGQESEDAELAAEAEVELKSLTDAIRELELRVLLNGRYDSRNAIVALHAGAGGTEAQDWVQMLLRMYTSWGERHGFKVEVLDLLEGDEAGVKSVTLGISGENAYGFLRPEKGVHRLVRISPFDASGRRHTSFASVDVTPEVEDDVEIEIRPEDLKIDTFRSGGAGGQHVNKTESAIRITHIPSGIVVACQQERSQIQNRATAMRMLSAKLLERKMQEQAREIADERGEQQDIAWGSQIRSYVFQPYSLVKDHRTNVEIGNVQAVMDGEIDPFIYAYLQQNTQIGRVSV